MAIGTRLPSWWFATSGPIYNAAFWLTAQGRGRKRHVTQDVFLKVAEQIGRL